MSEFWKNFSQAADGSDATWQILVMLLGAFLLGYLLRWFQGSGSSKDELKELKESNKRLREELESARRKASKADELPGIRGQLDKAKLKNRDLEKEIVALKNSGSSATSDVDNTALEALKRTNRQLNEELEACRRGVGKTSVSADTSSAQSFGAGVAASTAVKSGKPSDPDDLTKIEGVGKKIQEHLNNGGIWSFEQLAASEVSRLQEILDAAGPAYTMHDPGTWPEQGALARDGKWEKLKKWQGELKGGRKRKKR